MILEDDADLEIRGGPVAGASRSGGPKKPPIGRSCSWPKRTRCSLRGARRCGAVGALQLLRRRLYLSFAGARFCCGAHAPRPGRSAGQLPRRHHALFAACKTYTTTRPFLNTVARDSTLHPEDVERDHVYKYTGKNEWWRERESVRERERERDRKGCPSFRERARDMGQRWWWWGSVLLLVLLTVMPLAALAVERAAAAAPPTEPVVHQIWVGGQPGPEAEVHADGRRHGPPQRCPLRPVGERAPDARRTFRGSTRA